MIDIESYLKTESGGDKDTKEDSSAVLKMLLQYPFIKDMM